MTGIYVIMKAKEKSETEEGPVFVFYNKPPLWELMCPLGTTGIPSKGVN
jgi:hypothetical protein